MMLLQRRSLLLGSIAAACLPLTGCGRTRNDQPDFGARLRALEAASGSDRLGVAMLDSLDGTLVGHRIDERFTMCSTFKLSLAAAVLARMDSGAIKSDAVLPITKGDLVGHAPAVKQALDAGETHMGVLALAEAAQVVSDNGAANILLRHIGGPEALTAFWRTLGDDVSRLDRYEPALNTSHGDDHRDTSSPAAMARSLQAILTGPVLKAASQDRLTGWMIKTRTGLTRLRNGLPAEWRAGDKTGTNAGDGSYASKANDVAVIWHPQRAAPFFVTAFLESPVKGAPETRPEHDAVLAQAGRIAAEWITGRV